MRDAGAIAVLHALAAKGETEILGIMHCTSNNWGAACIDALNVYFGKPDIPVGTLKMNGFLDDELLYSKFNKSISEQFPDRYKDGYEFPDAVRLYREILSRQEDHSVVIVGIGPLVNLMLLLQSKDDDLSQLLGAELVLQKVKKLLVMGDSFPEGKEWNFEVSPEAAQSVTKYWPTPIIFAGFEIGAFHCLRHIALAIISLV